MRQSPFIIGCVHWTVGCWSIGWVPHLLDDPPGGPYWSTYWFLKKNEKCIWQKETKNKTVYMAIQSQTDGQEQWRETHSQFKIDTDWQTDGPRCRITCPGLKIREKMKYNLISSKWRQLDLSTLIHLEMAIKKGRINGYPSRVWVGIFEVSQAFGQEQ